MSAILVDLIRFPCLSPILGTVVFFLINMSILFVFSIYEVLYLLIHIFKLPLYLIMFLFL